VIANAVRTRPNFAIMVFLYTEWLFCADPYWAHYVQLMPAALFHVLKIHAPSRMSEILSVNDERSVS
jgi:hypothetical protein